MQSLWIKLEQGNLVTVDIVFKVVLYTMVVIRNAKLTWLTKYRK